MSFKSISQPHPDERTYSSTYTKRKRQSESAKARKRDKAKSIPWYEEWEQTEADRFAIGVNPQSPRFERIQAAATDFLNGRKWPNYRVSQAGPRFIFEKFLDYIGVLREGRKAKRSYKKQQALDEDDDDDDDDTLPDTQDNDRTGIFMDRDIASRLKTSAKKGQLVTFFHDPAESIKIFLSSYARRMGFIWSDLNLDCMASIIEFFIKFLLRSKVLPENDFSLHRSLDIINVAKKELPNTSIIAKAFPDVLSRACAACWGWKGENYQAFTSDEIDPGVSRAEDVVQEPKHFQTNSGWQTQSEWAVSAAGEPSWSNAVIDGNAWRDSVNPISIPEPSPWDSFKQDNLMSLLGPTVLPLTHMTGIVEKSMRRIQAIIPLSTNLPKRPPQPEGFYEPDALAVESDLDSNFIKVVLEPMPIGWDGGEVLAYAKPEVVPSTSQGPPAAVADPDVTSTAVKCHDPSRDEIYLLIEPKAEVVNLLSLGMGLGGTWVQIIRAGKPVKMKQGETSESNALRSYWYLDTLAVVIPSFWNIMT